MSDVVDRSEEFDVIYADPPWRYDFSRTENREIENHYPTMDVDDIKDLDVPAADESVCYMWATAPKLTEALDVLESWGFHYTTSMVWDKQTLGMGYWARSMHELLLIGKRGEFSPPEAGERPESIIREDPTEHSKKPKRVYRIIEDAYPDASKVELFARDGRLGWKVWGNEAPESKQATLSLEAES